MKKLLAVLVILLIGEIVTGQTDTLTNAKSYKTNFIWNNVYGIGTNTNVYGIGFTLNYDGSGNPLPATMQRFDLVTHASVSKVLPSAESQPYMFWRWCFDSSGNLYTGFNSNGRKVYKFWLKDTIRYKDLGNSSPGGDALAYSMLLSRDRNVYIGNSSSQLYSTGWAWIDTNLDTMYTKPEIDSSEGYNMVPMGDTLWCHFMIGQNPFKIWAVNKNTGYKKQLFSSTSLINTNVKTTGNYAQQSGVWKLLQDTTLITTTLPSNGDVAYIEVNVGFVQKIGAPLITNAFFDEVASKQYWTLNGVSDSMNISSSYSQTETRVAYADLYNSNIVYYVGQYYGATYKYYKAQDSMVTIGKTGLNAFSTLQYNDSIQYIAGYPSAQLCAWNKNQDWTAETFLNGQQNHLSQTTNPKLVGIWKSYADFQEPKKLIRLDNGIIATYGDVIRTGQTTSLGFYDPSIDQMWGLNSDSIYRVNGTDIAGWRNKVILSTDNGQSNIGTPKLFIYDTDLRTLVDSLDFGFSNYGKIYVIGDALYGIAPQRFYRVNLSTRQLTYNRTTAGAINYTQLMSDTYIGDNVTTVTLPIDFMPFRTINNTPYSFDLSNGYYYLRNQNGTYFQILNQLNVSNTAISTETAQGKLAMLKYLLQ